MDKTPQTEFSSSYQGIRFFKTLNHTGIPRSLGILRALCLPNFLLPNLSLSFSYGKVVVMVAVSEQLLEFVIE